MALQRLERTKHHARTWMWQRRHDSAGGVFEGGTLGGAPTKQPAQKSVHPIGDRKAQALPCRRPHAMLAVVNHVLAGFRDERPRYPPMDGGGVLLFQARHDKGLVLTRRLCHIFTLPLRRPRPVNGRPPFAVWSAAGARPASARSTRSECRRTRRPPAALWRSSRAPGRTLPAT